MKASKLWTATVFVLFFVVAGTQAQQIKPNLKEHEQKVRDMVAFLEYVLNTIGNSKTAARDKDVLIRESYTKIFRDAKVQVEDDLVEKRNVITNKDVQAYLKDVDFFYENVEFEFTIKDISGAVNANDKLFYKVSLLRNIKGVTAEGKTVNNTIPRYIEINYDPKDQDLKIVSIYTNEFDEKVALLNWWKELSFEWQSIFKKKLNILTDSMQLGDIKNIIATEVMDLSENQYIQTIEPLGQLINLHALNLSNTSITDLNPIRNLTDLVELDLSNTRIEDISALKYSEKLVRLNISSTAVTDISVLERMNKLESLEMVNTNVFDLAPISYLPELTHLNLEATEITSLSSLEGLKKLNNLNVSKTAIDDLNPLGGLKDLTVLNLDSIRVKEVTALRNLEKLIILHMNYTLVSNLRPLQDLPHLEKIYCDHTPIRQTLADAFMAANPKVLVIFDSEDLRGWWDTLSEAWQQVLSKTAKIQLNPSKEELAKITNVDSINIAGNSSIQDLKPLQNLQKLRVIIARETAVSDLSPLMEHREIRSLDISDTEVVDISVVSSFAKIEVFRADKTQIQNIDALIGISALQRVYVDQTAIGDVQVQMFLQKRPACLVVYKTSELDAWWNELSAGWKEIFGTQTAIDEKSRKEDLHRLVELDALHFKDVQVSNLSALHVFVKLKELDFSGTAIADLSPLIELNSLSSLHATNSPIRDLGPLASLTTLTDLDISNTPVEDLMPVSVLENLQALNCSGTQIRSVDALKYLQELESLDCSNTSVRKISAILGLPLKTLKCYNTKVSVKTVEKFKSNNPNCNVVYY
ncbi:MAG: leucine-rich repeat domain-containing protein [Cyclobacteriaceae bacterium]|nr:leucine-rich repeat domain-containing protein [Cyclobacteriaceae bacterium]MDH4296087.1 leucine-rich repeat domain-containing protein [Cyclobacteriaceae bacterium]MDH5249760.1 leucine-rich repeat domain-containing protein [Cyclobacteriaceae bacterium]